MLVAVPGAAGGVGRQTKERTHRDDACSIGPARWVRPGRAVFAGAMVMIANFFFIPYYPFWSIIVIAVDVFIVWALARVVRAPRPI
jgi:hypothetical protein